MHNIYFILLVVFLYSCQEKVSTLDSNTNEVRPEAVANFEYNEVEGKYSGKFKDKPTVLQLDGKNYSLKYGTHEFKGKYYHQMDGSIIELEYMEYQTSLPFHLLKIEDPSFLVIMENDAPTEYYLEK